MEDDMILTLQKRGTITVTRELRNKLGIEPGELLEADIENGRLILTPVSVIPRTLTLTDGGEKKIKEAEEDINHGRVKTFDSADELLKELEEK